VEGFWAFLHNWKHLVSGLPPGLVSSLLQGEVGRPSFQTAGLAVAPMPDVLRNSSRERVGISTDALVNFLYLKLVFRTANHSRAVLKDEALPELFRLVHDLRDDSTSIATPQAVSTSAEAPAPSVPMSQPLIPAGSHLGSWRW